LLVDEQIQMLFVDIPIIVTTQTLCMIVWSGEAL
jgi:hypothetical protein